MAEWEMPKQVLFYLDSTCCMNNCDPNNGKAAVEAGPRKFSLGRNVPVGTLTPAGRGTSLGVRGGGRSRARRRGFLPPGQKNNLHPLLTLKSVETNGFVNSCKRCKQQTAVGPRGGGVRVVGAGFGLKYKYYISPSLVDCIPRLRDNLK